MARPFRLFVKKRGSRRTGSQTIGQLALTLFFAICFFTGIGSLMFILLTMIIPEWRVNRRFKQTECVVLDGRVGEFYGERNTRYRPEILIRYEVGGVTYEARTYDITGIYTSDKNEKQAIVDRFAIGQTYPCWYDPANPRVAVLVRGYIGYAWLMLLLPASFITVGGGGLIYTIYNWGKSAERRAVATRMNEIFDVAPQPNNGYPCIPCNANITNSPGTTLAFRLPLASSPIWNMWLRLAIAVVVNGLSSIFVVMAVNAHLRREPDWLLTLFAALCATAGGVSLYQFIRQLLITTGVGATIVEISDHPLYPGEQYDVMLSQSGRLKVNDLKLLLVCEEQATFAQGTNARTDRRKVYVQEVFSKQDFEIQQGISFETRCQLAMPADAMHTFKSLHNEVLWKWVVKGNVAGWPDFDREFPVVVYPARNGRAAG